jgi:hypothetical protein
MTQLITLAEEKYNCQDPHFICQFVRGQVFILVDALLANVGRMTTPEDLQLELEFFDNFMRCVIQYLKCLPCYLPEYIEARAVNPNLYLVMDSMAIVSCYPELIESLGKMFGSHPRCQIFFNNNDIPLKSYPSTYAIRVKERLFVNYNGNVNCINYFATLKGFDEILNLLSWKKQITE